MPTPIGHALGGWVVTEAYGFQPTRRLWSSMALVAFVANLADIDYLPGLLIGHPSAFHQHYTHSFVAAILVGAVAGLVGRALRGRFIAYFVLATCVYSSHLLLDYLSLDTSPPIGLALFWPFSSAFFKSSLPLFQDVWKSTSSGSFFPSLFVWHNLAAVLREIALLAPLIMIIGGARSRKGGLVVIGVRQDEQ